MRIILATILLAAIGYSAYWHISVRNLDAQISATLAHSSNFGASDYDLGGFPHRFDLTLHSPHLHTPDRAMTWQGAVLNIHALSYQPHHVIAVFPPEQVLDLHGQEWILRSPDARASLVYERNQSGDVDRANLVFDAPELTHQSVTHTADSLRAAINRTDDEAQYEVALELSGLRPDATVLAGIDPNGTLPPMLARSRVLATLAYEQPLRVADDPPTLREITINEMDLIWGDIALQATGRLRPDIGGTLSGQLDLRMSNWDQVLQLLVAASVIAPDAAQMAQMLLTSMSDRETGSLDLPLQVRQSVMSFGPVSLGRLPRF
ncbi:DUF2125 domain-containing protein [Roseinatronobacter sp. S2]|uniref:DUF2125 domain-containing protein n=1 Tax=Roseinatronobacter sp. S2 TaxID=3035471 RepID=UPI00240F1B7F|nr:DUF2125 domain-containing protein [Roseinatronobacter sp. S2]WFE73434.1 DUF2125 domain-containing protein [Roseinatronobacter sp. S2]